MEAFQEWKRQRIGNSTALPVVLPVAQLQAPPTLQSAPITNYTFQFGDNASAVSFSFVGDTHNVKSIDASAQSSTQTTQQNSRP